MKKMKIRGSGRSSASGSFLLSPPYPDRAPQIIILESGPSLRIGRALGWHCSTLLAQVRPETFATPPRPRRTLRGPSTYVTCHAFIRQGICLLPDVLHKLSNRRMSDRLNGAGAEVGRSSLPGHLTPLTMDPGQLGPWSLARDTLSLGVDPHSGPDRIAAALQPA
jgi:hypothetical protein